MAEKKSIAAAWFTMHYAYNQRDFKLIEKYGNPYHPILGYYDNSDPEIMKTQLKWIRRSGIDVVLCSGYGCYGKKPPDLINDKTLKLFMKMLENQDNDKRKLYFSIDLESYASTPTLEEFRVSLDFIKREVAGHPYYFNHKGKHFVMLYVNDVIPEIISTIKKEFLNFNFQIVSGEKIDDSYSSYIEKYPQTIRDDWMPASPGFDSSLEEIYLRDMYLETDDETKKKHIRRYFNDINSTIEQIRANPNHKEDNKNGQTYRKQLSWAYKNKPEIIFISGWNDWQFGNQIEPAKEYGFMYVDMTAEILEKTDEASFYKD